MGSLGLLWEVVKAFGSLGYTLSSTDDHGFFEGSSGQL